MKKFSCKSLEALASTLTDTDGKQRSLQVYHEPARIERTASLLDEPYTVDTP